MVVLWPASRLVIVALLQLYLVVSSHKGTISWIVLDFCPV
jgi:hypothetical protein